MNLEILGNCLSASIIQELETRLQVDQELQNALLASLRAANVDASANLETNLYQLLTWPQNVVEYLQYLIDFASWIPAPYNRPVAPNHPPGHDQAYDKLCHFHFLIAGSPLHDNDWFMDWLPRYSRAWGSFLDTTASFSQDLLDDYRINAPLYEVLNSMISDDGGALRPNNPSGWLTFNQFFARELNPGLHPISDRTDNRVVCSPADCTFRAMYCIDEDSRIPQITIKGTHRFGSIPELVVGHEPNDFLREFGEPFANVFAGGKFVHYFLSPYSYHRFHAPVSGMVRACYRIHGRTDLDVHIEGGQFDAPDAAEGGYEFRQARGVLILDTSNSEDGDVGLVAVLPIGMSHVSSVNMTAQTGFNLRKGDEFGYFLFGGSDIIMLFQRNRVQHIDDDANYRRYGQRAALLRTEG